MTDFQEFMKNNPDLPVMYIGRELAMTANAKDVLAITLMQDKIIEFENPGGDQYVRDGDTLKIKHTGPPSRSLLLYALLMICTKFEGIRQIKCSGHHRCDKLLANIAADIWAIAYDNNVRSPKMKQVLHDLGLPDNIRNNNADFIAKYFKL